ncbi:SIS domain-containing protein [Tannockella kyphosi]|uniref:SIS domain-containing protein n=1 Tax=Tannockella kyphosi TaxID=2899121 RepID=UPI00201217AD|nr:SIS domain-containing protein [Tannockella kyphosi]
MKEETKIIINEAFKIESGCLSEMSSHLDVVKLSEAVEILINAPRIGTSGCGHSGIMCQHFSHLLCCIDRPSKFISPAEAIHGGMGFLQKGDVLVLASRGGKTKELIPLIGICKNKGVKVITITENMGSEMALESDIVLKQYVNKEVDRYNCQGTTSSTALCMIFHVLQTAIMEEIDYKVESFALVHPGGAVGERLNSKK